MNFTGFFNNFIHYQHTKPMLARYSQYHGLRTLFKRWSTYLKNNKSDTPSGPALLVIAIFVVGICHLRLPARLRLGFIWAEDGKVFLKSAYENGLTSIFKPYAGYFHFDIRLITYVIAKMASIPAMPYLLPWVCVVAYVLIAMYLYAASLRITGGSGLRPLVAMTMALAPFLVPQTGEVYLSVTNLQWILAPAMLACICELVSPHIANRLSRTQLIARGLFLLTGSMTGPFGPLFLIVATCAVGMTWHRQRSGYIWASLGAFAVGAVIQGIAIVALPNDGHTAAPESLKGFPWISEFLNYFIAELFYPGNLNHHRPGIFSAIIVFLMLAFLCTVGPRRLYKVALLSLAMLLWYLGVQRGAAPDLHITWTGYGSRYLFIPHILIVWVLAITLATSTRLWIRFTAVVGILLIFSASLQRFETLIWNGQQWAIQRPSQDVFEIHLPPGWDTSIKDNMHHGL